MGPKVILASVCGLVLLQVVSTAPANDSSHRHGISVAGYRSAKQVSYPSGKAAAPSRPTVAATEEGPVELVTERYPNGSVKVRRHVTMDGQSNYVNHGPYTEYDVKGQIQIAGQYRMGKKHGLWKRHLNPGDEDFFWGKIDRGFASPFLSEARFVDDQLDGCWTILSHDGDKILEWRFEENRCVGTATTWFPDGTKQWEIQYRDGRPIDAFREWNARGELIQNVPLIDGCSTAQRVGQYRNGQKSYQGTVLVPSKWGRLVFDWWATKVAVDQTVEIGPERKHGLWTEWYADGAKKFEGEYREGVTHGKYVEWYANGEKRVEGTYKDGEKSGIWSTWTEDGTKDSVAEYAAGLQFWVRTR